MTRRKKGGLGALGNAFKRKGRRRKGRGLVALAPGGKRRSGSRRGLADYIDLGDKVAPRRRGKSLLLRVAANSLSDRLSPTERAQMQTEIDEAISDDQMLLAERQNDGITNRESILQRLVRSVRERFRRPVL